MNPYVAQNRYANGFQRVEYRQTIKRLVETYFESDADCGNYRWNHELIHRQCR
jgi:dTDP-4-dehydrorhamnose 3,5-epimerase-like enzyme